jgi:hypothetical protein
MADQPLDANVIALSKDLEEFLPQLRAGRAGIERDDPTIAPGIGFGQHAEMAIAGSLNADDGACGQSLEKG